MHEGEARQRTPTEYRRTRSRSSFSERPDRIALWAFGMAIVVMIAAAASAHAGGSGGTGPGGTGTKSGHHGRYARLWDGVSHRDKRWARRTSECESGGNPKAVSPGGTYRGAFQFSRPTWRSAPKSPGGDPIRYRWRTQAVVAVYKKHRDGTSAWPSCG